MAEPVLGLDVGGAHLKAALVQDGRVLVARQVPCRLWEGLARLDEAFEAALAGFPTPARVALTMTGELVDLFPDRDHGVRKLLDAAQAALPRSELVIWAGRHGFVGLKHARKATASVASANWLATGTLVSRSLPCALLIDIGSTTTDIVPVLHGTVRASGETDAERLAAGELVYQGMTRTPVMAIASTAPFRGRLLPLMNEHFATAADIWRLLGTLDEAHDQHPAADNGPKTAEGSARRLARMLGLDLKDASPAAWRDLAAWFAERQLRRIEDSIRVVLSREVMDEAGPLVAAGCGRLLVNELARRLRRPWQDVGACIPGAPEAAVTCAPAAAVALLAEARRA
jgi:probable H4MPT-linked C1 transfer pathway protein